MQARHVPSTCMALDVSHASNTFILHWHAFCRQQDNSRQFSQSTAHLLNRHAAEAHAVAGADLHRVGAALYYLILRTLCTHSRYGDVNLVLPVRMQDLQYASRKPAHLSHLPELGGSNGCRAHKAAQAGAIHHENHWHIAREVQAS